MASGWYGHPRLHSRAAKLGWKRRKERERKRGRAVLISIGYKGSKKSDQGNNSFRLVVAIHTFKKLSNADTARLVEVLARDGHFEQDFDWITVNDWKILKEPIEKKLGTAELVRFERIAP